MFGNSSRKPYVSSYILQIKFACMHVCAQSCPTPCYPMDCSSPDSSVLGILQATILEWVAISFSRGSSQAKDQTCESCTGKQILHCGHHLGCLKMGPTWNSFSSEGTLHRHPTPQLQVSSPRICTKDLWTHFSPPLNFQHLCCLYKIHPSPTLLPLRVGQLEYAPRITPSISLDVYKSQK